MRNTSKWGSVRVFLALFWQEVLAPTEWLAIALVAAILTDIASVYLAVAFVVMFWLVVCAWCALAAWRYVRP